MKSQKNRSILLLDGDSMVTGLSLLTKLCLLTMNKDSQVINRFQNLFWTCKQNRATLKR